MNIKNMILGWILPGTILCLFLIIAVHKIADDSAKRTHEAFSDKVTAADKAFSAKNPLEKDFYFKELAAAQSRYESYVTFRTQIHKTLEF